MMDEALKMLIEQSLREIMPELVRQALREVLKCAPSRPKDDGYLTTAEAALWARVNPATIRQWINKGHLPRHRAGRELRVSKGDLRAFLSRQPGDALSPDADEIANEIMKSL